MVSIELRKDGWFEAGKNSKESFPYAFMVYQSKQKLKQALEEIGEQTSKGELEKSLSKIEAGFGFKRTPYLEGTDIIIATPGLPGECYLGSIKD